MFRKNRLLSLSAGLAALLVAGCNGMPGTPGGPNNPGEPGVVWLNHLDLLPGDASVQTSFTALTSSAVGGLNGLDITSTTTGDIGIPAGNKVVLMGVETPPHHIITGVRVCYQLSNAASFITQIRLAQVQDPPSSASVLLDDGTDQTDPGPVCVDSTPTSIDPQNGALQLSLRLNFADTSHAMVVRSIGLHVKPK
jgi:hypothetical protein